MVVWAQYFDHAAGVYDPGGRARKAGALGGEGPLRGLVKKALQPQLSGPQGKSGVWELKAEG